MRARREGTLRARVRPLSKESTFTLPHLLSFRGRALAVAVSLTWAGVAAAQGESQPAGPPGSAPPPSPSSSAPAPAPPTPAGEATAAVAPGSSPAAAPATDATLRGEVEALRDEVRALRAQVDSAAPTGAAVGEKPPIPPPPPPRRPLGYEAFWPWVLPPDGISLGGYLQSQYESHQDSQDQLAQGGALLNKNRFSIRRARVSLLGDWEYVAIALELDANTTSGPQVDLRKAEASLQYRPDRSKPPIIMATLGQFDTPFGYELVESPRTRWFMERSQVSQGFWPGEPDLGLRLAGALGFFRWTIAAVNGEPLGEKTAYPLQDPNSAKDVVFRFGFDAAPRDDLQIAGGVSALRGTGFSPGTDATKSGLQWEDSNDNGLIDSFELTPIQATLAKPSSNFQRWAAGADLRLNYRSPLGVTKIYGEFLLGSNMDRNMYYADPIETGVDQRELGFYAGVVQELGAYAVAGFRYDYYDPNSNLFDKREGLLIPYSEAVRTASPLVGLTLPDRARLVFQYDFVRNALARTAQGVPTDLKANVWTVRLQVQL
jgi:hypothetical protein